MQKPLLVIPPSPDRWKQVKPLLRESAALELADLEVRMTEGVPHANDAFCLIPDGADAAGFASLRRRGEMGVLGPVVVRGSARGRGLATRMLQTLLAWFDMSDGKWLVVRTPPELGRALFGKFGFEVLRSKGVDSTEAVVMMRHPAQLPRDPNHGRGGRLRLSEVGVADWPELVVFQQFHAVPDANGSVIESALTAEERAMGLIRDHGEGRSRVVVGRMGGRVAGVGAVRIDSEGARTQAFRSPLDETTVGLRGELERMGGERYEGVLFPFEQGPALAAEGGGEESGEARQPGVGR